MVMVVAVVVMPVMVVVIVMAMVVVLIVIVAILLFVVFVVAVRVVVIIAAVEVIVAVVAVAVVVATIVVAIVITVMVIVIPTAVMAGWRRIMRRGRMAIAAFGRSSLVPARIVLPAGIPTPVIVAGMTRKSLEIMPDTAGERKQVAFRHAPRSNVPGSSAGGRRIFLPPVEPGQRSTAQVHRVICATRACHGQGVKKVVSCGRFPAGASWKTEARSFVRRMRPSLLIDVHNLSQIGAAQSRA